MDIRERFVVIFKKDGLDIEEVRRGLNEVGPAKVTEEVDDIMTYIDDQDVEHTEAIHMYYMDGPLFSKFSVQRMFNCFTLKGIEPFGDDGQYVLMPR